MLKLYVPVPSKLPTVNVLAFSSKLNVPLFVNDFIDWSTVPKCKFPPLSTIKSEFSEKPFAVTVYNSAPLATVVFPM